MKTNLYQDCYPPSFADGPKLEQPNMTEFNPYETLKNYLDIYVKEDKIKSKVIQDLRIEYIKRVVCNYYSLTFEDINNGCRERDIIEIKQFIQFFCRKYAKATYKRIGKIFTYKTKYRGNEKGLDHTSVMSNERKIQGLISIEKVTKARYREMTNIIEADIEKGIIKF